MTKGLMKFLMIGVACGALVSGGEAGAAGLYTNGVPPAGGTQYPTTIPLTGNELFPADTQLPSGVNPASESISSLQLEAYGNTIAVGGNVLIGGDATTNLWQRATTGASETTTYAYGGPDRWAYWSGASTAVTLSRDSTASDISPGYQYAFKLAETSGQTGVVQICMAQEVESVNSYQLQGKTVELSFNAYTGANFNAANNAMTAYIVTGTGADEGMQKLAWGLNAGGGGSTAWTGQANATAAVIGLGGVSTAGRYVAVANIPATATEVGVALCWTPNANASTNSYIAFSGIQLKSNQALASFVSATAGYSTATVPATGFDRRPQQQETALQQRYFWLLAEPAASKAVGNGNYQTITICDVQIPLPTQMRAAPTLVIGGTAESATTWAVMVGSVTPVALASTFLIQDAVVGNTVNYIAVQGTTASKTAGFGCTLVGAGGGANIQASAEL